MTGRNSIVRASLLMRAWRTAYTGLRESLRCVGFGHERWPRTFALIDLILDPFRTPAVYNMEFAERIDPWNYGQDPSERLRHSLAVGMLDRARDQRSFVRALEIGCGEGHFTQLLSRRCDSLLAVDFSSLAVERAQARIGTSKSVSFSQWNLRRDPIPGNFDLLVVMDVLTGMLRPRDARSARSKLVEAMRRDDYLLVCDHRQNSAFENSWWGKALVRGGKWIVCGFTEHPDLECLEQKTTETHVLALLRRR